MLLCYSNKKNKGSGGNKEELQKQSALNLNESSS